VLEKEFSNFKMIIKYLCYYLVIMKFKLCFILTCMLQSDITFVKCWPYRKIFQIEFIICCKIVSFFLQAVIEIHTGFFLTELEEINSS
jgi:hypothetical protein